MRRTISERTSRRRRLSSFAHRSTSRWRYRVSVSVTPRHLSPKERRASASSTQSCTLTDSSPRRVRTTSPLAPTQSPRFRRTNASSSSVVPVWANSCTAPLESRSSAKATLPWVRRSMTRPDTETVSPDSSPAESPSHSAATSAARWDTS